MKKICIIPLVLCTLHFLSCSTGVEEDQNKSGSNAAIEEQSFITYSFYSDNSSSQAWITISGKTGEPVPHVSVPKKTNYCFNEWKSADGEAVPYIFGEKDLDFYAEWKLLEGINRGNLLGSKTAPDALYDLVFSDGSAMPYPDQLDSLTSEQINNVVAMIYTTTYNPNTGSNTTGNFKLGAGFLKKNLRWCSKEYSKQYEGPGKDWPEGRTMVYNLMYTGYKLEDTDNDPEKIHVVKSLNPNYGLANYYDFPMFEFYLDSEYAPAFYYATNYGYYKNIVETYRKNWYLPSIEEIRALFKNEEARRRYMQLSLKVNSILLDNVSIWTNSTDVKQTETERDTGWRYVEGDRRDFDDMCLVRFPGVLKKIKVNVNNKSGHNPGHSQLYYDIYYLFYSKAYCIDYKGNQWLKEKDEEACVIPIRIF